MARTIKNLPAMWEIWVGFQDGKILWRRKWQPTPVLLPGESHEQRSLAGYNPWGLKELDRTEWVILIRYVNRSRGTFIMQFLDNVTFSRNPTNANSKIVSLSVAHLILPCNALCISHLFKIVSFSRTGIMMCIFFLKFFIGGWHGTIDWFQIGKGVHQGCVLSPCLHRVKCQARWSTSWNQDCWEKYQ